jgi:hypothetical protein
LICLVALLVASPLLGLQADPLSGTWSGDWGPNAQDRNQVTVDLKWDGKVLTGVVRTANRQEVTLEKSSFDPATSTVRMTTSAQNRRGGTVNYVIEGKLSNGVISGTWNHDAVKGDFTIKKAN